METSEYSQAPYSFGVCAATDCPKSSTCLRHLVLEHITAEWPFLPTLNPAKLKAMKKENCEYYRPNEKVRYAKGFTHTADALTVRVSGIFRSRLISRFGRKNYYLARKGEWLINPADQQYIIRLARELGVQQDDYFDEYVERYNWG